MGAGSSTTQGTSVYDLITKFQRTEAEAIQLMMPIYYTEEQVNDEDLQLAQNSWNMILNDTSPKFLSMKGTEGFTATSCVMFFYDIYYHRLFDIHPMCRSMFKSGMKTQGKFLVKMISLILMDIKDINKFTDIMVKLTESHSARGVKAVEYGIVGEVLFWSLRNALGDETYTAQVHMAWTKIYSRILQLVVPLAVAHEIESGGHPQKDRMEAEAIIQRNILEFELNQETPRGVKSFPGE